MIARLHRRITARRHASDARAAEIMRSAIVDQLVAEQRRPVTRPARTLYDETCAAKEFDPLDGKAPSKSLRAIADVHGFALAAPLRGAK